MYRMVDHGGGEVVEANKVCHLVGAWVLGGGGGGGGVFLHANTELAMEEALINH